MMRDKEIAFVEWALLEQRVMIRRTPSGIRVFRKDGQPIAFLLADEGLVELHTLLHRLADRGFIVWPPDW